MGVLGDPRWRASEHGRADGVHVDSAGGTGLFVATAAVHGVDVAGNLYAGVFAGNIYVGGNCIGCLQANFAVNAGDRPLQPGDVVSIQAITPSDFDTGPTLWQVVQAQPGQSLPRRTRGPSSASSQGGPSLSPKKSTGPPKPGVVWCRARVRPSLASMSRSSTAGRCR